VRLAAVFFYGVFVGVVGDEHVGVGFDVGFGVGVGGLGEAFLGWRWGSGFRRGIVDFGLRVADWGGRGWGIYDFRFAIVRSVRPNRGNWGRRRIGDFRFHI